MSEFDTGYSVDIGKPVVHAEKKATGSSVSFPCEAIPDGSHLVSLEVNGTVKAYRESMEFSDGSCTVGAYTLAYSSYALTVSGTSNNDIVRVMVEPLEVKTTDAFRAAINKAVQSIELYKKPTDGIPETDLAQAVKNKLNKFVVTLTPTAADYSGTMDKTVADIKAAYEAGREILFRVLTSASTAVEIPLTYWATNNSYEYNGFAANLVKVASNVLIVAYVSSTSDGTRQTYDTKVYSLTTAT